MQLKILFLVLFTSIKAMEDQQHQVLSLDALPYELKIPIVIDIVITSHVEDAGKTLRSLQLVNKGWRDFIDAETVNLTEQRRRFYKTPRIITAAYFGTKAGRDYFEQKFNAMSNEKKLSRIFKHALFLASRESRISNQIVGLTINGQTFKEESCLLLSNQQKIYAEHIVRQNIPGSAPVYQIRRINADGTRDSTIKTQGFNGSYIKMYEYNEILIFSTIFDKNKGISIIKLDKKFLEPIEVYALQG